MQSDLQRLRGEMRRTLRLLAGFHFPAMACLAAVAHPLVVVLLTDKWIACVPYLQIIAFAGMLYPVHALHLSALTAQGRSDLFLRLEIIKKGLVVVILLATSPLGVMAMVWGILGTSVLCLMINGYYTRKYLQYGWISQARDIGLPALAATAITLAAWAVPFVLSLPPTGQLALQCAVCVLLFVIIAVWLRHSVYSEAWELAMRYRPVLRRTPGRVIADVR